MPANLENSAVATGWERSIFISIPKEGNAKECSNYHAIALISHASKIMLKILQARFKEYVNWKLQDVQAGFRKVRGTRDQIANICWIIEKAIKFTLMAEGEEELNSLLIKVKEESEKAGFELNIKKMRWWHLVLSLLANRWWKSGNSVRFHFLGPYQFGW